MICTSLANKDYEQVLSALEHCEMAEIRLDSCSLSDEEIEDVFYSDVPLVATCRTGEGLTFYEVERRLKIAIKAGARYADLEIGVPKEVSKRLGALCKESGTVLIRSWHDCSGTDSVEALKALAEKCVWHGAEIVKIVTTASSQADVRKVMSLYEWARTQLGKPLIAFCMGEAGRESRLECLKMGAPFTYAALSESEKTAPGQWTAEEMSKAVYGDFRFCDCEGALQMPSSKSYAQRAIIAAALADGESHLRRYVSCGDSEAAVEAARELGAQVSADGGGNLTVRGIGATTGCLSSVKEINACQSGLLARLMQPLMSQLSIVPVTIRGEQFLDNRGITPMTSGAPCRGGRCDEDGAHSSQRISGLLMSIPLAVRNTTLNVSDPVSIPYMYMTLDVLKKFGVKVSGEMTGDDEFAASGGDWSLCDGVVFRSRGLQSYRAADLDIEADWSAAAAFLVAGAVFGRVELAGLDTSSLQADLTIMDILMDAGASLSQTEEDGPHKGNIVCQRAPLAAFTVDATNCPDLFPILSVLACFCDGTSEISGLNRLAHKECDRGAAIDSMLSQMGVGHRIDGDTLVVEGENLARRCLEGRLLRGGRYTSCHDHRMAMALKVASLGAASPVEIDDTECLTKSYPGFLQAFGKISIFS